MKVAEALLISLFFALLIFPQLVFAQQFTDLQNYLGGWFSPESLIKFLFPGYPDEWLRVPQVLYYVIIPFITAFTVLYGLLMELRIFRNQPRVNTLLAFLMAFLMMPSGILTYIVTIFYAGGAFIGVMAFIIVFIIGVLIWGYGTSFRFWGTYSAPRHISQQASQINQQIRWHQDQINNLQQQIRPGMTQPQMTHINRQIRQHEDAINTLSQRAATLRQQLQQI